MKNNEEKIKEILSVIFDEYDGYITTDLTQNDIVQWDSLASAQIIMTFENEFNMHLTDEQVAQIYSIEDIIRLANGDE